MKISVQVKPGSKKGNQLEIQEDGTYLVHLKARAHDGEANNALIKFLAKELGLKQNQIEIKTGHASRTKILQVAEG